MATYHELLGFGLEDLAGKTIISSAISDERLAELGSRGVDMVLDTSCRSRSSRPWSPPFLEAMLKAMVAGSGWSLTNDDLLDMIDAAGLEPARALPQRPAPQRAASRS